MAAIPELLVNGFVTAGFERVREAFIQNFGWLDYDERVGFTKGRSYAGSTPGAAR
jgi:hypothetical protein